MTEADHNPRCLNCRRGLRGQYCSHCGQRSSSRLISIVALTREAFGDLFEMDSRLWRTLIPLLLRPGHLTREYLEGRRVRYMPPFRTYLVLSLIFFVFAFFDPRSEFGIFFEAPAETAGASITASTTLATEPADAKRQDTAVGDAACDFNVDEIEDMPVWLQRRATPERLQEICRKVTADGGRNFFELFVDKVPVALIVLLPLMAVVLKILYPLSRRYFVEHLLFFVHFHAFVFLILSLTILAGGLASIVRLPESLAVIFYVVASLYIPVYLYRAMRTVYRQGHALTASKFVALSVAYGSGVAAMLLATMLFTMISL